jgi:hypothetical protein
MSLGSEIRDPGSGINLFRIPDPGSRGQKGPNPGSGSATLLPSRIIVFVNCSVLFPSRVLCQRFILRYFLTMLTFQAEWAYWYFSSSVAHRTCLYWNTGIRQFFAHAILVR